MADLPFSFEQYFMLFEFRELQMRGEKFCIGWLEQFEQLVLHFWRS
jgi:hypothetical protein